MTVRSAWRRAHRGERGVTLIELLVTIAIMALSFVAMIAAFSVTELQVRSTSDDAQLAALARQVTDAIEAQPLRGGIAYVQCSDGAGTTYLGELATAGVSLGSNAISITVAQAQGSGSSHVVSPNPSPVPLIAISSCSGSAPDYGVQQITIQLTSKLGRSLQRTVYKRWN